MSGVIRIVANFCDCRFWRIYVDQVGFASPLVSFGLWSYEYLIRSKCDHLVCREAQHHRFLTEMFCIWECGERPSST